MSKTAMRSWKRLLLAAVSKTEASTLRRSTEAPAAVPMEELPFDEGLFEKLRRLRQRFASERGIPPYMVFSNRTLRATPPSSGGSTGATRGVGYNSSRSNNTNGEADAGGSSSSGGTRAQDYNSSRSNTDGLRLDDDSDGDSLEEVRCSMRSDDCVSTGDGNDLVLRKRPGR